MDVTPTISTAPRSPQAAHFQHVPVRLRELRDNYTNQDVNVCVFGELVTIQLY